MKNILVTRLFTLALALAIAIAVPVTAFADATTVWHSDASVRAADSSGDRMILDDQHSFTDGAGHDQFLSAEGNWGGSTAEESGTAGFGSLKGKVIGGTSGGFGVATLRLNSSDFLTVAATPGSLLSFGDPVDLRYSFTLEDSLSPGGSTEGCGISSGAEACNSATAYFGGSSITDDFEGPGFSRERVINGPTTWIVHTTVGARIAIGTELDIAASADLPDCDPSTGATCPFIQSTTDASHTALFFIDPLTAGATYSTDSGFMYLSQTSAVPEPGTLALFGSGLAALAGAIRRKSVGSRRPECPRRLLHR